MISKTHLALAVALPLLFFLFILTAACVVLFLRLRRLRAQRQLALDVANDKCAKLEKRVAQFPEEYDGDSDGQQLHYIGFSSAELENSFIHFHVSADTFMETYIAWEDEAMGNESVSRVGALSMLLLPFIHDLNRIG